MIGAGEHIAEVALACVSDGEISEMAYDLLKDLAKGDIDIDNAVIKVLQYYNIEVEKC